MVNLHILEIKMGIEVREISAQVKGEMHYVCSGCKDRN